MSTRSSAADRRASPLKNLGLCLLGLACGLLLVEAGMRIAGWAFLQQESGPGTPAAAGTNACTILCLGESTTAGGDDAYPHQLERTLNATGVDRYFAVVNRGIPGCDTDAILSRLEADLARYRPALVVAMMGINDTGTWLSYTEFDHPSLHSFLRRSRVVKLIELAARELRWRRMHTGEPGGKRLPKPPPATPDGAGAAAVRDDPRYEEAKRLIQSNRARDAIRLLEAAVADDPDNAKAQVSLGRLYLDQGDRANALNHMKAALKHDPRNPALLAAVKDCGGSAPDPAEGSDGFRLALDPAVRLDQALRQIESCGKTEAWPVVRLLTTVAQSKWSDQLETMTARMEEQSRRFEPQARQQILGALGALCLAAGNPTQAGRYFALCETIRRERANPRTAENYRRLRELLRNRNVKLVCVQYPMQDLDSLKKRLEPDTAGIAFVDNSTSFRAAVASEGIPAYFTDMFNGDFGHCTLKGNMLLASNVASVIIRDIFGK